MTARQLLVPLICLAAVVLLADDQGFVRPKTYPAQTYPASYDDPLAKVAVAADPYDLPDKQKIFHGIKPSEESLLPILLVITNDNGQPIVLRKMKVELVTVKKDHLLPMTDEDIARRINHPKSVANQPRSPLPIPGKKTGTKGSITKEQREEVDEAQFRAMAVEAHSTQDGFLFFDIEGIQDPLAGAHLYVSGIRDANGNEVMFFDLPMEKYLTYQPGK